MFYCTVKNNGKEYNNNKYDCPMANELFEKPFHLLDGSAMVG
jgi:hypothetical protein